jgi:hypothetical protein
MATDHKDYAMNQYQKVSQAGETKTFICHSDHNESYQGRGDFQKPGEIVKNILKRQV